MKRLQKVLETSVTDNRVPFAVGMVADSEKVKFSGAAGNACEGVSAGEDTIFRIFSMTKAIGATAAMILIDRGKLEPDTPVEAILPEYKNVRLLKGYENGQPVLVPPTRKPLVSHLATHTSGMEYEFWNTDVVKYMEVTGHPGVLSGLEQSLYYPLMTEPGTRWGYGPNIDWLGRIVEQIDGRSIVDFCQAEIFDPLGMSDTSFEVPASKADRLADVYLRGEGGQFSAIELNPPSHPEVYGMGHALYGTAPDYIRFLRMFLNEGELDGERILSKPSVKWMLQDHMNGLSLNRMNSASPLTADVEPFDGAHLTHSFGFVRNTNDIPGRRKAGSQSWAGVLNSHYWFDPTSNVAAVIMTQTLPFWEQPWDDLYADFEKETYRALDDQAEKMNQVSETAS